MLSVSDRVQYSVHKEELLPLVPGEWREVDVVVHGTPADFACRIRSESGQPIHGVKIAVRFRNDIHSFQRIDPSGEVLIEGTWATKGQLGISADGYVPVHIGGFEFPAAGRADFELVRGRALRVQVRDPGNMSAEAEASVQAIYGSGLPILEVGGSDEEGGFPFQGLPAGEVQYVVKLAGEGYRALHDTDTSQLAVEVPYHGSLRVIFNELRDPEDVTWIALIPSDVERDVVRLPARRSVCRFESVLPGAYQICFQRYASSRGQERADVSERVAVTIRPQEVTEVGL